MSRINGEKIERTGLKGRGKDQNRRMVWEAVEAARAEQEEEMLSWYDNEDDGESPKLSYAEAKNFAEKLSTYRGLR